MSANEHIGIIGAGAMGRGIAQIAVAGGFKVTLWDASREALEDAQAFIEKMLRRLAEKGRMNADDAESAIGRLFLGSGMQDFADAGLVIEAIIEDISIKKKVFSELESIVSADCILASNTSSLPITAIAAGCAHPERVAGYHFFNPVPLMKVVEVIATPMTAGPICDRLADIAARMGHRAVRASDSPGFLVNHAGRGLSTEGLRIVTESIAEPFQVDEIMRDAAGFRMGPFELFDLTGLDVSFRVMESIYEQFYQEPRFRPAHLARQRFTAGLFGRKSGEGFYKYIEGKKQAPPPVPVPDVPGKPVWLGAADSRARNLIAGLGAEIDGGKEPGEDSLLLVTPVGGDATTAAVNSGLDAKRTVALDVIFGLDSRRTLMTTPVTRPEFRDAAHALLAGDSVPVTVIRDSAGFVAQRIVATIVNIASDIAQQGIATPEDIDAAVQLGLGYPKGPLALGDAAGGKVILGILENMYAFYGDARYRPSPWLKRRALLDISLSEADA